MSTPFTDAELDVLHRRVTEAESGTSGEIVVYVVGRSGAYEAVLWRGGAVGLAAAVAVWTVLMATWPAWGVEWLWSPLFDAALLSLGAVAGTVLARRYGPFFRAVAGSKLLAGTVKKRAQRAFLEEGVMETVSRTGILLFVSVVERRIEVLADKGIASTVPEESWREVVDLILSGLRQGNLVDALSDGIAACGALLRASGIRASGGDRNELRDDIRFEAD